MDGPPGQSDLHPPLPAGDAAAVGRLIADTYRAYNLGFASSDQQARLLGPFAFAGSADPDRRADIARAISARWCWWPRRTASSSGCCGEAVGTGRSGGAAEPLRRRSTPPDRDRAAAGGALREGLREDGVAEVKVAATVYAVPFYQALGYRRSTGVRTMGSFQGRGCPTSP